MLLVDDRWNRFGEIGIGRFSREVLKYLPEAQYLGDTIPVLHPGEPLWLSWKIRRLRPNAYFSPGFNAPLISKSNLVFVVFDLMHIRYQNECSAWKKAYYWSVVKPACKSAFRVLTASQYSKTEILAWTGVREEQVTVVGAGVDAHYRPGAPAYCPGYPYVLYIGNRRPHKNIPRMLEGFATSHAPKDVILLMSGDADSCTTELAKLYKIEHKVKYLGHIKEADMPSVISGATGLLIPSLCEGFGLPALEAMACGTPAICSTAASLPEVVGQAALQIDPHSVEDIAMQIDRVLSDTNLRRDLKAKGIAQAAKFGWDKTASSVRKVLYEAGGLCNQ